MKNKNIRYFIKQELTLFIVFFSVIIFSFLFIQPKVASNLFPFKRQQIFNTFITDTVTNRKINPQSYWEFREFYSPGSFEFSRQGFQATFINPVEKRIHIILESNYTSKQPFLIFNTKRLQSIDYLTKESSLSKFIDTSVVPSQDVLLLNNNTFMYKESGKIVKTIFLLPLDQMKKANGFFEYDGKDKEMVKDTYWLNTTSLLLD